MRTANGSLSLQFLEKIKPELFAKMARKNSSRNLEEDEIKRSVFQRELFWPVSRASSIYLYCTSFERDFENFYQNLWSEILPGAYRYFDENQYSSAVGRGENKTIDQSERVHYNKCYMRAWRNW